MRILVTGGAGFLGAHLCKALLARGDEVVAVDNFATSNRDMVEQLTDSAGFTFIEGDICANPPVKGDLDAIAHLACPASPDDYRYKLMLSRRPHRFVFDKDDRGKTVWFAARWQNARGNTGVWSPAQSTIIP